MSTGTPDQSATDLEKRLRPLAERYRGKKGVTIPLLADLQQEIGYVSPEAVEFISRELDIPAAEIFGVATFYAQFHLQPRGRHIVRVCRGTACHVRGSALILDAISRSTGIAPGQTSADGRFSLERVACFGSCALAPVVVVDDKVYGRMTAPKTQKLIEEKK